jgi:hypothetical protein
MLKIAKYAITTNILLAILFLYSNFALWNSINGNSTTKIITSYRNPLFVSARHYSYVNGVFDTVQGIFSYGNTPFWIFFILLVVNLIFFLKLSKDKVSRIQK